MRCSTFSCYTESRGSVFDCTLRLIIGSRFRNSILASLLTMSVCARIIISVALQQVDHAPNAKTGSEGNDEGLQNIDCAIEEIHILCAGIVSLWFLRWKPQSRNELAAVCGCRFRLLLSNFRLCFPPTLRFACVCCIVGVLLYGMGV